MNRVVLVAFLSSCVWACGNGKPAESPEPAAASPAAAESSEPAASAAAAPSADPPAPAAAPAPKASLSGTTLTLTLEGKELALSKSAAYAMGKNIELHFEQPMDAGYTQIWLVAREPKAGKPATVKGTGMSGAFVQLGEGKSARNVSNDCTTEGTITFDTLPTAKKPGKGAVDVTITCFKIPQIPEPLVIKGTFEGLPLGK